MLRERSGPLSVIVGIAGFALYWPMLRQFELGSLLGNYAEREAAGALVLVAVLLSLLVLSAVAIGARRTIEPFFARRSPVAVTLGCAGSLGAVLLMGAPVCGILQGALVVVGAVCMALGYLALTLAWASALLAADRRQGLVVVAAGYALAAWMPLIELLGESFALGFTLLSPVGSVLAWRWYAGGSPRPEIDYSIKTIASLPLLFVGMIALFLFVGRVSVGALIPIHAQIELPIRLADAAVALLFAGAFLVQVRPGAVVAWDTAMKSAWVFLALLVIAGLLSSGASWHVTLGEGLVAAGFNCFELFLWVLLMRVAREQGLSVTLVFCGVFSFCKVVPVFCGKLLAPQIARWLGARGDDLLTPLMLVLVFLLVAATFVFLTFGGRMGGLAAVLPGEASTLDERARRYGLTPREVEVIGYVLNGYSYQKTADTMGVSLSTVQSHVKNLYRKLGVHTKDELVDWAARGSV